MATVNSAALPSERRETADGSARILYVVGQLDKGGAEQQLAYLLENLRPKATVLSLSEDGYWAEPIRRLGYEVIELGRSPGVSRVTRLWTLARLIRSQQPDVVHVFMDGLTGLYGRLAALIARHPHVIVGERRHPSLDAGWYSLLKRVWLNRHVAAIVANARSSQTYLIAHDRVPTWKAVFIPNGLNLSRFDNRGPDDRKASLPESWRDKVIIGMVCGLRPKKAPETFLRVAKGVLNQNPDVRFVHVGDGPLRDEVARLSRDLGVQEFVLFMGERNDVPELLRAMDIFILTSRNEGAPNAVMEAMAAALPCVATDAGDCAELIGDGETGFVVPIDDEERLVDRLLRLVPDAELRQSMGMRGQARIQAFDLCRMAEQYRELYCRILNGRSVVAERSAGA